MNKFQVGDRVKLTDPNWYPIIGTIMGCFQGYYLIQYDGEDDVCYESGKYLELL